MTQEKDKPLVRAKLFAVVDYGMGNLASVLNAFRFLGAAAFISHKAPDLEKADAIILPGVGAFGEAMANLKSLGLIPALRKEVMENKKPFLGICLGMQLIARDSEEKGRHAGLGWIDASVRKISPAHRLRLPHIGWNNVTVLKEDPLFRGIRGDFNFYFVHSYHLACEEADISCKSFYGLDFAAGIQKENILAVQFHPEKSQKNGLRLLRNFINFVEAYPVKGARRC